MVYGKMAGSDFFRIKIGDTGDDAGYAEIATADSGNEPIYIRQYLSNGTTDSFLSLIHEACLLDTNGNTSFPGIITASSFNGIATSSNKINSIGAQSQAYSESNILPGQSVDTPTRWLVKSIAVL